MDKAITNMLILAVVIFIAQLISIRVFKLTAFGGSVAVKEITKTAEGTGDKVRDFMDREFPD